MKLFSYQQKISFLCLKINQNAHIFSWQIQEEIEILKDHLKDKKVC